MKKIVIVGMGVAGSYLARLINEKYELVCYDGNRKRGCKCGWGSSLDLLGDELRKVDMDVTDYWLCKPEFVILNDIRFQVHNGIFINKPKMLADLTKKIKVIPNYITFDRVPSADWTINATAEPLETPPGFSPICYTVQWKASLDSPERNTVYLWFNSKKSGYAWIFPLDADGEVFHVGSSGSNMMRAVGLLKEMLYHYNFAMRKRVCACGRLLHYGLEFPIFNRNVVSIGEAAGCVYPITDEGILPSIQSAQLLAKSLDSPFFPANYAFDLQEILSDYHEALEALETFNHHRRFGLLKLLKVMTQRMQGRSKPDISLMDKTKALIKFLL